MAKLAEYFVFYQHYKPSQITILTPYLGQKRIVKELLQGLDDKRKGSLKPGAKRLAPMSAEAEELMAENEERFAPVEKKDKEKKENEDDNHSADHVVVATVEVRVLVVVSVPVTPVVVVVVLHTPHILRHAMATASKPQTSSTGPRPSQPIASSQPAPWPPSKRPAKGSPVG